MRREDEGRKVQSQFPVYDLGGRGRRHGVVQVQPRVWEGGGRTGGAGGRVSDQVQAGSHLDVGDEEDCHCHRLRNPLMYFNDQ